MAAACRKPPLLFAEVAVVAELAVVALGVAAGVVAAARVAAAAAHAGDGAEFAEFHDLTDERQSLTNSPCGNFRPAGRR